MDQRKVVSHDEWIKARKRLLVKEKELTRLRDKLSAQRRKRAPYAKLAAYDPLCSKGHFDL